jgi:hypothetical protein
MTKPKPLPATFVAAVHSVLKSHVGLAHAMPNGRIVAALSVMGVKATSRQVRAAARQLRREGVVACSSSSRGHYLAASPRELADFLRREIHSRAVDLLATEAELRVAGAQTWPVEMAQLKLPNLLEAAMAAGIKISPAYHTREG